MFTLLVGYVLVFAVLGACGGDFLTEVSEAESQHTLVHSEAFTQQLSLVRPDAGMEQFPLTEEDVQYLGIAADKLTGDIYIATSNTAIQRVHYDSSYSTPWKATTVLGGKVEVRVVGYNLGASLDDVVSLSIKGVDCPTLRRESSNSLLCVSGDPVIATDSGVDITTDDIIVQTTGGWTAGGFPGDFVDAKLADNSLKPIITQVEAAGHSIHPRAICFDPVNRYLYYSDIGTRSIERVGIAEGGSVATVEFDTFLPNVGLVYGIAVDAEEGGDGGFLYFSDAESGTVSRIELSAGGKSPSAAQVLASRLIDPMCVALEPNGGARLFFTLYGGSIRAVSRDGSVSTGVPQTALLEGGGYEVRRFDSGTRLDGIAVSESESEEDDPTEPRLYWSESGRIPRIRRSSMDGTRPTTILVADGGTGLGEAGLTWPRGLAFGAGNSTGLLYCERLGGVRLLLDPADGQVETVVEASSYPAAAAIQALIQKASKKGVKEAYFVESMS